MRTAAKFATAGVMAAAMLGMGAGAAFAGGDEYKDNDWEYAQCNQNNESEGLLVLLPLNLDVLTYCDSESNIED